MKVPFVDLQAQQAIVYDEMVAAAQRILKNASFILGQDVSDFEAAFADYCGVDYAIGVDSGHSALKLSLLAYGIGGGDDVLIPANTFIATAAAVSFTGANPIPVDIDATTFTMDPAKIEAAITPNTKAIMPVHLYGTPVDMTPINAIAEKHGLIVVEDSAQAVGARYHGARTGSLGHAAAFSFYPAKNLGACGDAGIVTTSDADVAERIRGMRNVGQLQKNIHELAPYNHRLDTLQAAFLHTKMNHIDDWNAHRRFIAQAYDDALADTHVMRPQIMGNMEQVWHLYVVRTPDRDAFRAHLQENGIASGIHYPTPIHLHPYYEKLGYKRGDYPVTEACSDEIVSLPIYETMTTDQVELVAESIRTFQPAAEPVV
ncbi:MAG: DegT/DnrJ/EryC1/StrS family aminotransferase [Aggregatilineales bacterium]